MSRSSSTLYRPTTKYKRRRHPTPMTKQQVKQGISDGTIPSAISDTGATSTAGALHDPFHFTTKPSTKVFLLPTGGTAQAAHISQLMLNVRAPANQVDIDPNLTQTLLSGSKFADAGYTAVYDKDEVNFSTPTKSTSTPPPSSRVTDVHTPGFGEYPYAKSHATSTTIPSSWTLPVVRNHSTLSTSCHPQKKSAPSLHHLVRGSSTPSSMSTSSPVSNKLFCTSMPKTTWMAAIRRGNYDTWPLVTVANVHKHFPQLEDTQQGHMRSQRQGVRSTKTTRYPLTLPPLSLTMTYLSRPTTPETQSTPIKQFPHVSSRGYRYQMILYHTDSNSIWVEATKNRTEGELILARTRALSRMRACGLSPKRQVLDNEASAAYKQAILDSGMTYQLVPPDDHRRNVAKKPYKRGKITRCCH
eukprot:CCRYP_010484-RA/>CCRYP_010484-RA protein AED:0.06 eAED:0.05 QI:0/0/0/1/0/0.5/2/0/413